MSGTRRRIPSASGTALRKPDPAAACVSAGRLHTAPVAWKYGSDLPSPGGWITARPSGRRLHGRFDGAPGSNVSP